MNDLTPGFTSAFEAQSCFRAILDAFSTPGHPVPLPVCLAPPPGLSAACASVLLTLADTHTKVALPKDSPAQNWLTFHTGAPAAETAIADFCVATSPPPLACLLQGTDAEPENSATLILEVEQFSGSAFKLSGPGLKDTATVSLPLNASFLADWHSQASRAPLGVDIILCAGNQILALPRSLHIMEA